jgi:hypothetical protein
MNRSVEIKVNIDGDVDAALSVLGLPSTGHRREIWFADRVDRRHGGAGLALHSEHVIIRVRSGSDGDLTVKLRPCAEHQLVGRWARTFSDADSQFTIERDWSGSDHVLSAKAVCGFPRAAFAGGLTAAAVVGALTDLQRRLLAECAASARLDGLELLGPVSATKWPGFRLGRRLEVSAERWRVGGLDFLELSTRVRPDDAGRGADLDDHARARQARLVTAVIGRGLAIGGAANKTQRVLCALATGG